MASLIHVGLHKYSHKNSQIIKCAGIGDGFTSTSLELRNKGIIGSVDHGNWARGLPPADTLSSTVSTCLLTSLHRRGPQGVRWEPEKEAAGMSCT